MTVQNQDIRPGILIESQALVSLATDINREHDEATIAVRSGVEHARRAGDLLNSVKASLPHGDWLPWLQAHCPTISPWTAQAYMRLARRWPELEAANTGRVTHLSTRAALQSLTAFSTQLSKLPESEQQEVLDRIDTHGDERLMQSITTVLRGHQRARLALALEYRAADRPATPTDRVVTVRREHTDSGDCWTIRIGPNQAAFELRPRIDALKATPTYVDRQAEVKGMFERVAELRAEADALERSARQAHGQIELDIRDELEREHGPACVYVETISFWKVDEDLATLLPSLELDEQIDALYAQGSPGCRGYWGDITLSRYSANGPGRPFNDQKEMST